jgi:repressor LexA
VTAAVTTLLTSRQRRILNAVRDYYQEHGYPPSLREIATLAGLSSPSSVQYQLGELERMGWIRRHPNRPRALIVLDPSDGSGA